MPSSHFDQDLFPSHSIVLVKNGSLMKPSSQPQLSPRLRLVDTKQNASRVEYFLCLESKYVYYDRRKNCQRLPWFIDHHSLMTVCLDKPHALLQC